MNPPLSTGLIPDVLVYIVVNLLMKNGFNVLQDNCVIDQFTILGNGHFIGLMTENAIASIGVTTTEKPLENYKRSCIVIIEFDMNCSITWTDAGSMI